MEQNRVHIHSFKDTIIYPTCRNSGYTLHKCECGYEHKDNFTPISNHSFTLVHQILPTCTIAGTNEWRCTVCGTTTTETLAPIGHAWSNWSTQKFASCTEDGLAISICARCKEIAEQTIPATGHKLTSRRKSRTEKGVVECFCQNCGQTVKTPSTWTKTKKSILSHKKILFSVIAIILLLIILAISTVTLFIPYYHYASAKKLIEQGKDSEAYLQLLKCENFKDSKELLEDFEVQYEMTESYISYDENGEFLSKTEIKYNDNGDIILNISYDENDYIWSKYEYEYTYDDNDNVLKEICYDKNGNITRKEVYEYNNNNNMTHNIHYAYEYGDISHKYECEYEYDNNGNRISEFEYDSDGNKFLESKYEYDNNNNVISEFEYDHYGNIISKYKYEYDHNNNRILLIEYDYDGNIISKYKYEYEYNDKDNIIQCISYNEKDEIDSKSQREYDDSNNLIYMSTENYTNGTFSSKSEYNYEYDGNNNITRKRISGTNYLNGEYIYKYDDNGNLTLEIKYYENGNLSYKYEYEYTFSRAIYKPD